MTSKELEQLVVTYERHLRAFEHALGELQDQWVPLKTAWSSLLACRSLRSTLSRTEPIEGAHYRVRENGHTRFMLGEDIDKLRQVSQANLILDRPRVKLRLTDLKEPGQPNRFWEPISWTCCKVLYVGMWQPGIPFGNRTINRVFGSHINPRSLSRYVAETTRLIQGGGTKGPYLHRQAGIAEASDSGQGYVFDQKYHYLVIDSLR